MNSYAYYNDEYDKYIQKVYYDYFITNEFDLDKL